MKRFFSCLLSTVICSVAVLGAEEKVKKGWDDIDPVDYSSFLQEVPKVTDETSAMPDIIEMYESVDHEFFFQSDRRRNKHKKVKVWIDAYERVKHVYAKVDNAIATKKYIKENIELTFEDSFEGTIKMISAFRMLDLRTQALLFKGDLEGAWDALKMQCLLVKKMREHSHTLVEALVVVAIEAALVDTIDVFLTKVGRDTEYHKQLLLLLEPNPEIPHMAKRALRMELCFVSNVIDLIEAESHFLKFIDDSEVFEMKFWDALMTPTKDVSVRYFRTLVSHKGFEVFFQRNKTLKKAHDLFITEAERRFKLAPHELVQLEKENTTEREVQKIPKISTNLSGEAVLNISSPIILSQILRSYQLRMLKQLIVVKDAMRHYKDANGALPDSLSDLVPAYLKEVPVDFYTKDLHPLSYDAKRGLLWSAGDDGEVDFNNGMPIDETDRDIGYGENIWKFVH